MVAPPPPPPVKQLESNVMKFLNRTSTIKTFKAPKQGTLPPPKKNTSHRFKLQDTFVGTSYFPNFVGLNVFFRYGSVLLDPFW